MCSPHTYDYGWHNENETATEEIFYLSHSRFWNGSDIDDDREPLPRPHAQ